MQHSVNKHPSAVIDAINATLVPRGSVAPVRIVDFKWPLLLIQSAGQQALIRLQALSTYRETGDASYSPAEGRNKVSWHFTLRGEDWRDTHFRSIADALAEMDATEYRDRYNIPVSFPQKRTAPALPMTPAVWPDRRS